MNRMGRHPLLVVFDGPKGTGKTTLINFVFTQLRSHLNMGRWAEKDLDPLRSQTTELLRQHQERLTPEIERSVVHLLAEGRARISAEHIRPATYDLILMDRWYPADAAFRRLIPFEECLAANRQAGAVEPDLVFATVCDPAVSWQRAHSRSRGLSSVAIASKEDHERSSIAFSAAAVRYGWRIVRTEPPVDVIGIDVLREISAFVSQSV